MPSAAAITNAAGGSVEVHGLVIVILLHVAGINLTSTIIHHHHYTTCASVIIIVHPQAVCFAGFSSRQFPAALSLALRGAPIVGAILLPSFVALQPPSAAWRLFGGGPL